MRDFLSSFICDTVLSDRSALPPATWLGNSPNLTYLKLDRLHSLVGIFPMDNGHEAQPLVVQSMPEGNDQVTCGHFTLVPLSSPREKRNTMNVIKKEKIHSG